MKKYHENIYRVIYIFKLNKICQHSKNVNDTYYITLLCVFIIASYFLYCKTLLFVKCACFKMYKQELECKLLMLSNK